MYVNYNNYPKKYFIKLMLIAIQNNMYNRVTEVEVNFR